MNKKYLLDTNFIYALYYSEDALHKKALILLESLPESSDFVIPKIVVAELLVSDADISFLKTLKIFADKYESFNDEDLLFIEQEIKNKRRKSLKANDCILLAMAKRLDATLVTFNKKLIKAAKELEVVNT